MKMQIKTYEKLVLDTKTTVDATPDRIVSERESGLLLHAASALTEIFSLFPGGVPDIYILGDTLYECFHRGMDGVSQWQYGTSHGVCGGFSEERIDIKKDLVNVTRFHPPISKNNTGLGTITHSTYVASQISALTNCITVGFLDEGNFLDTELFLTIAKVSDKIFVDTQEDRFRVLCDLGVHLKTGGPTRPFYLLEVYRKPATLDHLIRWYKNPLLWMAFSLKQRTFFAGEGAINRILDGETVTAQGLKLRDTEEDFEGDLHIGLGKGSLKHGFKFIDL